ncbi:MAG TPA: globin, partial [Henriciella marina]|nr:globin [Henriciella marina]
MTYQTRSAEERRRDVQAHAASLGIDDAFIETFVETFYGRVR